jgi:hypothetical protein
MWYGKKQASRETRKRSLGICPGRRENIDVSEC